jgi:hypothetical protein
MRTEEFVGFLADSEPDLLSQEACHSPLTKTERKRAWIKWTSPLYWFCLISNQRRWDTGKENWLSRTAFVGAVHGNI